jgi:hypothetical protein
MLPLITLSYIDLSMSRRGYTHAPLVVPHGDFSPERIFDKSFFTPLMSGILNTSTNFHRSYKIKGVKKDQQYFPLRHMNICAHQTHYHKLMIRLIKRMNVTAHHILVIDVSMSGRGYTHTPLAVPLSFKTYEYFRSSLNT